MEDLGKETTLGCYKDKHECSMKYVEVVTLISICRSQKGVWILL